MLNRVTEWFNTQFDQQQHENPTQSHPHTVELATGVLLYEIMRADDKFEESERKVYRNTLTTRFSLSEEEVQALMEMTEQEADYAADFQQFTHVLNDKCNAQEKRAILDSLWQLAYADNKIDAHEEHLVRRIADLLYIPHSEYIQSKLKIIEG